MSSAAVVIGALRINVVYSAKILVMDNHFNYNILYLAMYKYSGIISFTGKHGEDRLPVSERFPGDSLQI